MASMICTRLLNPFCLTAAAAVLLAGCGIIGPGSGRSGSSLAAVAGLFGVILGGLALKRPGGRNGAVAALVSGMIGVALAGAHLVTNTGAIGTGSGRAGAIVALVLGLIGMVVGGLALARSSART